MESDGPSLVSSALRSHIPGSALIELPLGSDHTALKAQFALEHAPQVAATPELPGGELGSSADSAVASGVNNPPSAKKQKTVEITAAQAEALGIDLD